MNRPRHPRHAPPPNAADILKEASQWMLRVSEGPLDARERAVLAEWRARSAEHERTWRRAEQLLARLGALTPAAAAALKAVRPRRRATRRLVWLAATPTMLWAACRSARHAWHEQCEHTGIGERRTVTLSDGSLVTLNTDTEILIERDADTHGLRLLRGDILVDTAHRHAAPASSTRRLRVRVGQSAILARATRFELRQGRPRHQLAVFSGEVEIRAGAAMPIPARIGAGQQALFSDAQVGSIMPLHRRDAAWREGRLVAHGMPLPQFLGELERYRGGTLRWRDDVAGLKVSGDFSLADTDLSLALLEKALPVRVRYFTRYWVLVVPS